MKKKHLLKKSTALCTAALLGITAAPASAFAADSYASAEKEAWAKSIKDFASVYGKSMEQYPDAMAGSHADLTFTLNDSGRSLLGFLAPFDVSWLKDVSMDMDVSIKDSLQGASIKVLLNDSQVCTVEYYLDADSQMMYMRIPELSEKYFKIDMAQAVEEETSAMEEQIDGAIDDVDTSSFAEGYAKGFNVSLSLTSDFAELMPEASVVEELLNKYTTLIFDNIQDGAESAADTLTAEGISQECTVYEGQITEATAVKLATDVLSAVKDDKEIEGILETWEAKIPDSAGLYDGFLSAVTGALSSLKEEYADYEASDDPSTAFLSRIWVAEDGSISGRQISLTEDGEETPILTWKMPKSGSDYGYSLSISADEEDMELSGSGQIENDILNGTYQLSVDSVPYVSIAVSDYDTVAAKEGNFKGSYTVSLVPSEEDDSMAMLQNFALLISADSEGTASDIDISVTSAGSSLGTLRMTSDLGKGVDIPDLNTLKDIYDVNNEDDMNEFASSLDLTAISENLKNAGMPEDVLNQMLYGEYEEDSDGYYEESDWEEDDETAYNTEETDDAA